MRNHTIRFLTLLLVLMLAFICALPAFAANIDLGVEIISGDDSITVNVDDSEAADAILAASPAKLELDCSFDSAYVTYGGKIIGGSKLESGKITFPVARGGSYTIHKGSAFDVTFQTNSGSTVAGQSVMNGGKITEPEAPTKAGFRFDGWYSDAALTTAWDFVNGTVTGNVTLYAKWTDIKSGSAVTSGAGSWNPQIDAATLEAAVVAQGDKDDAANLRLTITSLADAGVAETEAAAIEALALGRALSYLDMTLECSINSGSFTDIGDDNNVLLKITLDFDPTGKSNIAVFRYHGSKAELLPTSGQGERFEVDLTNKKLIVYAKKFSTYAIGYTSGNDTLEDYTFSKGHNSSWARDSTRNLVFVCNGPFDLLENMTINGQDIGLNYAESCDDGTQITLKPAFLKNLARGKYYLELYYKNGGYAIAAFTVTRSSGIANTRDLFNMVLWGSLLGISAVGIITLVILKKRKK